MSFIFIGIISLGFLIAILIFISKIIAYNKLIKSSNTIYTQVENLLVDDGLDEALAFCDSQKSVIASVLKAGLKKVGSPIKNIENRLQEKGDFEIQQLEQSLKLMSITAFILPMIGFIGSGIILMLNYQELLSGDKSLLLEVLILVTYGLFVSLIVYILHFMLTLKLNKVITSISGVCNAFINLLQTAK